MAENMMRKIITNRVKSIEGRVLEFVGSTEMPDRDNEVIKSSAWQVDQYVKNPVVQWAHNYQEPPIGKTISIRQSQGKTIFQIEFAEAEVYEFADTIFKLCKGGFLNATSVGFIPLEFEPARKDGPARTYTKVELLEISIVPVPANPDALVTARNQGLITIKDFERITTPEKPKPTAKEVSQGQIKDELDYLLSLAKDITLNEENQNLAKSLIPELSRLIGSDMPIDIKATIRRTLSPVMKALASHDKAHQECFKMCKNALEEICQSDGKAVDEKAERAAEIAAAVRGAFSHIND